MKIYRALLGLGLAISFAGVSAMAFGQYWKNSHDSFLLEAVQVNEGEPAVFTVQVPEKLDFIVRWQYSTEDATAKAGSDYIASQGTIQFPVGERVKTITVQTLVDETTEYMIEFFQLHLEDMEISSDGVIWERAGYIPGLPEYAATEGVIRDPNVPLNYFNPPDGEQDTESDPESSEEPSQVEDETENDPGGSRGNEDGASGGSSSN